MASTLLQDVISSIFRDEFDPKPFTFRRQPRPLQGGATTEESVSVDDGPANPDESQRCKVQPTASIITTVSPELLRRVTEFLCPKDIVPWSSTCKASLAICLDVLFSFFRITQTVADRLDEQLVARQQGQPTGAAVTSWATLTHFLLEARHRLEQVYGPYHIHPLHAALVGETILYEAWCQESVARNWPGSRLRYLWDCSGSDNTQYVCGPLGDCFAYESDYEDLFQFLKRVTTSPEKIPPGPGRVLAEEGRMPFINVLCREADEETVQYGFAFQHLEGNTLPYVLFRMERDQLPHCDDTEEEVRNEPFYNGRGLNGRPTQGTLPFLDGNGISFEQAFCQFGFCDALEKRVDGWTQALRATWLYQHSIAPFDKETQQGQQAWARVRNIVIENIARELPDDINDEDSCADSPTEAIVLHINQFDDDGDREVFSKLHISAFMEQRITGAKASSYIPF